MDINIGNIVKIKGDYSDFTDHLDGQTLEVIATPEEPGDFDLNDDTIICRCQLGSDWYIYKRNVTEVVA